MVVDGHAVGGHAQGVLIVGAVQLAGADHRLADCGDVRLGVGPQILQIHHQVVDAPVGNQALGALHDDIGGLFGSDGRSDQVVAVLIVQGLVCNGDLGMDFIEGSDDVIQLGLGAAPRTNGVGPQRNGHAVAGSSAGSRRASGGSSSAAGIRTAAGGQQACCAHSTCDLQEVPAGNCSLLHTVLLLLGRQESGCHTGAVSASGSLASILQRKSVKVNAFCVIF